LIIVATVHEFSHGVFARAAGIKIKSTGFAFLKYFPALFGAFVEQDDKQMTKKSKKDQMSVLSAGVFANILTMFLFILILGVFFFFAFQPNGVVFNGYSYYEVINVSSILTINGANLGNYSEMVRYSNVDGFNELKTNNGSYFATKDMLQKQEGNTGQIVVYHDAPSIRANLPNIIQAVNEVSVKNKDELGKELMKYRPGDNITITAIDVNKKQGEYKITLDKNPKNSSLPYVGIWFTEPPSSSTIKGKVYSLITLFKESGVYYSEKYDGASIFVYNLFWWIILINLAVALFNMLPLGILDGGRFFYLGIWSLTKSEKIAGRAFKIATYFLLGILVVLMTKWIIGFF
jgi:membrane-associated protease RseP (regulator of RpoE activity)